MKIAVFSFLLFGAFLSSYGFPQAPVPGGLGASESPVTPEVKNIITLLTPSIQAAIDKKLGSPSDKPPYTPLAFRMQIVAGTNYFISIKLCDNSIWHVKAYQPLSGPATLSDVSGPKAAKDPIIFF